MNEYFENQEEPEENEFFLKLNYVSVLSLISLLLLVGDLFSSIGEVSKNDPLTLVDAFLILIFIFLVFLLGHYSKFKVNWKG